MKYDVQKAYARFDMQYVARYAIFGDGEPIHFLPRKCLSIEVGREFLAWWKEQAPRSKIQNVSNSNLKGSYNTFLAEFLNSREPEEDTPDADIKAGRVTKHSSVDEMLNSLKRPAAETEEATGENFTTGHEKTCWKSGLVVEDYIIHEIDLWLGDYSILRSYIFHIPSGVPVSILFCGNEDAEGFLKWWYSTNNQTQIMQMHRQSLRCLEAEFKRYKAEQEPEFVCPYCDDGGTAIQRIGYQAFFVQCEDCFASSPHYRDDSQPDASWI